MQELTTGLITDDAQLRAAWRQAAGAAPAFDFAGTVEDFGAGELDLLAARPLDVLVVDLGAEPELGLRLCEHVAQQPGEPLVVAVGPEPTTALLMDALRSGIGEYLARPVTRAALEPALRRAAGRRVVSPAATAGKVVAVAGAAGGAGTTTVAVNVAIAARDASGAPVLLADMDAGRGAVEVHLALEPRYTLADVIDNLERMDARLLDSMVERHDSGVHVLAGAADAAAAGELDEARLDAALGWMRRQYAVTVLDVSTPHTTAGAAVLAAADEVILVVTPELPAIRNAARMAASLAASGRDPAAVRLVVSRRERGALAPAEVARHTGVELMGSIASNAAAAARAIAEGRPLVQGRGSLARELRAIGASLAAATGSTAAPAAAPHALARLLNRGRGAAAPGGRARSAAAAAGA